jgi:8-oxo-dGTP pyrophosphatase MutT (NUDIX family)
VAVSFPPDYGTAHAATTALLNGWTPPDAHQRSLRRDYLQLLAEDDAALRRDGPAEHLTASCLVLDAARAATLLVHHAKGGFWVQPGGHWEPGDADLAATALREATEETGLGASLRLVGLNDLHRHRLSTAFGRCRVHCDVMFLAVCDGRPAPSVSPESHAVAWFDLADLPTTVVADLPARAQSATRRPTGGDTAKRPV